MDSTFELKQKTSPNFENMFRSICIEREKMCDWKACWLTLGIMSTGHNISGAWLLTPLGVGTTVTRVTRGPKWLDDLYTGGVCVVVVL